MPGSEHPSMFSPACWKKNPSVLPVVGCIALGITMAAAYTLRLAILSPDVTWNTRKNPHPQDAYEHKNYKLVMMEPFDIKTYEHPRPRF